MAQLRHIILFFIVPLFFLNACAIPPAPMCTKDKTDYCKTSGVFGGKWFDYYDRALSCMEGECYPAALSDLNQAIRRRDRDERTAKTYGMHFTDYFPHREKGLIHLIGQNYENAIKELELSLQHEPSAKAQFYLDEARKKIIEQAKQPVSVPLLFVESSLGISDESNEIWTKETRFTVSGIAEDNQYISEIILKDEFADKQKIKPVFMDGSNQHVIFREELNLLDQGRHVIKITARNLSGGKATQQFVIHFDRSGPVIILEKFIPGTIIKGMLYDESNKITLFINGNPVSVKKKKDKFIFELTAEPDMKCLTLLAVDRLGNQTKAFVHEPLSANIPPQLLVQVSDLNQLSNNPSVADTAPPLPVSHFSFLISQLNPVFQELVNIEGEVKCTDNIVELTINNEPVLSYPGRIIFFSHPMKLKQGENRCVIKAKDETGREAEKTIMITRKIPEIYHLKHRFRLGLYPFKSHEQPGEQNLIQYHFTKNIMDRGRFMLISRNKKEQTSEVSLIPHALVFGNICKTIHGMEITAQIVNQHTSEILDFIDVYADSKNPFKPELLGKLLSEKLHIKFPLIDGAVTHISDKELTVMPEKWIPGKGELRMRFPVFAYRKEASQGMDTEIMGETFINRLTTEEYGTAVVPGIHLGDGVITR